MYEIVGRNKQTVQRLLSWTLFNYRSNKETCNLKIGQLKVWDTQNKYDYKNVMIKKTFITPHCITFQLVIFYTSANN